MIKHSSVKQAWEDKQGPHAACGALLLERTRVPASPCFVFKEVNTFVTDLLLPGCASCSVPAACFV